MAATSESRERSPSRFVHAFEASSLWVHAALVVIVLLAGLAFVQPAQVWSSDEGAIRLQADAIESGSWFLDRPFSDIDPEGVTAPIQAATVDGDRYAPFTKHPVTPITIAAVPGDAAGWQPVVVSLAASLTAALLMAFAAGTFDRRARVWALWSGALGTSLFFYGFTVLHHSAAVALAAVAVAALLSESRFARGYGFAIAVAAVFVLPFLRREGVLFGVALGLAVAATHRTASTGRRVGVGALIALGGVSGMLVNGWWARLIAGEPAVIEGDRPFLSVTRVVEGFSAGVLDFDGVLSLASLWVVAFVVGWVGLGRGFAAHRGSVRTHWIFAAAASIGALGMVATTQPLLAGFAVAMPWLIGGLFLVPGRLVMMRGGSTLLVAAVFYAGAVIVTQERHAGGAQWGGRYLLLVLPLLVPVIVTAWRDVADTVASSSVRAFAVAGGVSLVVLVVMTVVVLDRGRSTVDNAVDQWIEATEMIGPDGVGDRPVWLSPDSQLGRFAWHHVDEVDMLMIPKDLDTYIERYTALDPERFLYLGDWNDAARDRFAGNGYAAIADTDDSGPVSLTVVGPRP